MKYGEASPELLNELIFKLPADTALTKATLAAAAPAKKPAVYVGCGKWGRKEWVGNLYPIKTREADFLDHYVGHFNAVELNATHYKIYDADFISKWAEKAKGMDFKFCPKLAQRISHFTDLVSPKANDLTTQFLNGVGAFGKQLGPVFVQVNDKFSPQKSANLYTYLTTLPRDFQFFFELRHAGWYNDAGIMKELMEHLRASGNGLVITDTAGRRDALHMNLPIPKAFIRFQGYDLHPSDYPRMDAWAKRIEKWLASGLQELYFFMHQPDEKNSPTACDYFIKQLNKQCGLNLKTPF